MTAITNSGEDLDSLVRRNDHLGILRHLRLHRLREPDLVLQHGTALVGHKLGGTEASKKKGGGGGRLSDAEHMAVVEQLCMAAIDLQKHALAESCLADLKIRVDDPQSARFKRLVGLCLESSGDLDGATELYDDLLASNPANAFALKRKYCILRAQVGKEVEAMGALNAYVERNQGDAGGWLELANRCLDVGDYGGASYCYEELVLANPLDSTLHCRLGELYATVGGLSNLKLARKHMAQSLDLCPPAGNLRALYGLVSVAASYLEEAALAASSSSRKKKGGGGDPTTGGDEVEVATELLKYGAENLIKLYKGTKLSAVVAKVMEDQLSDVQGGDDGQ